MEKKWETRPFDAFSLCSWHGPFWALRYTHAHSFLCHWLYQINMLSQVPRNSAVSLGSPACHTI
jgi:hypothetical protein